MATSTRNIIVGMMAAIVLIAAFFLALHFYHRGAPPESHHGGCCCCGGGGSANGTGTTAQGPGTFGNPGATIITGAPVMSGLPNLSGASYDGLVHIHIDPTKSNGPVQINIGFNSSPPGAMLILKKVSGGATSMPSIFPYSIPTNGATWLVYNDPTQPADFTIGWDPNGPPNATLTVNNQPPNGYAPGSSNFSGTYTFNGGFANLIIH